MKKSAQSLLVDPDDKDRLSKIMRLIANILVALIVVGGWYYSFTVRKQSIGNGAENIGNLRMEFQKIPLPEGASRINELVVNSKSSSALVQQRYGVQLPFDLVLAHYDKHLKSNGWTYLRHYSGGRNGGESYCKGANEANIELMPKGAGGLEYYFSISWSDITAQECSEKFQPSS